MKDTTIQEMVIAWLSAYRSICQHKPNLFPQRPDLNRGYSEAGRRYRRMERYAATHSGTFVYSRLIYNDATWVPCGLEYGVELSDSKIWIEYFDNT